MLAATRKLLFITVSVVLGLSACQSHQPVYRSVATDSFEQTLRAWRQARPGSAAKKLQHQQIIEAAENMLLMQRNDGGWPTGTHPLRVLTEAEREAFIAKKPAHDSSFRHHNVFPQVYYLSHVYLQTGDVRYRDAARDGLKWVMRHQFYNGGWPEQPHATPAQNSDDQGEGENTAAEKIIDTRVTLEALIFLRKIAAGKMPYGYIPFDVRRKVAEAVRKGDEWLLRVQQAHDSHASIWAQSYALESSAPVAAGKGRVPVLDAALSVEIVRYFMAIERPPAPVVRAVEGAVKWYGRNSLQQWQVRQEAVDEAHSWMAYSPMPLPGEPVWSHYYDIQHNLPLTDNASVLEVSDDQWFAHRAQRKHWYGDWPTKLLREDYPRWREKNLPEPIARSENP